MEHRHFRYAVAVADTLHFGQVAHRLHISQPPLSQQIRQFEEELGVKLFHRTQRQVQLTDAGKMFIAEARVILARAGELGQLIVAVAGPGRKGAAESNAAVANQLRNSSRTARQSLATLGLVGASGL